MSRHIELMHTYNYAIQQAPWPDFSEALSVFQKKSRTDISKLSEIILTCGGTPPSGTNYEAEDFSLPNNQREFVQTLNDLEKSYGKAVDEERNSRKHRLHSLAVLDNIKRNSDERCLLLSKLGQKVGVPVM